MTNQTTFPLSPSHNTTYPGNRMQGKEAGPPPREEATCCAARPHTAMSCDASYKERLTFTI